MRLLPREDKFYEYFRQQAALLNQAASLLVEGASAGDAHLANVAHQIRAIEEQADGVVQTIFGELDSTFITPLDPEDIHALASHLDDVIDGMEDAAHRIMAYRIDSIPPEVVEMCRVIQSSGAALQLAFDALAKGKPVMEHCLEVKRLEKAADQLSRTAVADLFHNEKDPVRLLKLKEVYEFLEGTTDSCQHVATALQHVEVKQ